MATIALFTFKYIIYFLLIFWIILPIAALIDISKSEFKGNDKLMWILLVIFTNPIGAILYFTIGKNQKINYTLTNRSV